jgi:hypothetical protein
MSASESGYPVHAVSPPLLDVLTVLLEARLRATQSSRDSWDFAEEIQIFHAAGSRNSDLRWLVCQGFVDHAEETTQPGDPRRTFRPGISLAFTPRTCFVLTETGLTFAQQCLASPLPNNHQTSTRTEPSAPATDAAVPVWDADCKQLWFQGQLIKEFRVPSPNQELILAVFQELHWPPHIDDPLPPIYEIEQHKRLHDTITRLNRHHLVKVLRFRGNGGGTGVLWEATR